MSEYQRVIFVVDDNAENGAQLATMLSELQVAVQTFQSAEHALTAMDQVLPLMLVLDADMPQMNGYQMINQMLINEQMRQVPVLLMTTNLGNQHQNLHGALLEVIDTISKPISPTVFMEKARVALELERYQQMVIKVLDNDGQAIRKKHEGVVAMDYEGRIKFVNASALRMLRTHASDLIDVYFESLFQDPCHQVLSDWQKHPIPKVCAEGNILQVEKAKLWCADGGSIDVKMAAIPLLDQGELDMFVAFKMLKKDSDSDEKLKALSKVDALTGLPTREKFSERVDLEIGRIKRHRMNLAILYIDLMHFNNINESLGHEMGDHVLQQVAQRLEKLVRIGDFCGRIGGDTFALAVTELPSLDVVHQVAEKFLNALKAPHLVEGYEVFVGTSIGVATFPNSGKDAKTLLKNADVAAKRAENLGGDRYHLYSAEMNQEIRSRVEMEQAFRQGFKEGSVRFEFRPVFDRVTRARAGFEVVPLWQDPQGQVHVSEDFFPIAEQTGLMAELVQTMLDQGGAYLAAQLQQDQMLFTCFKVTPFAVLQSGFQGHLQSVLDCHGLSPNQLMLELCDAKFSRSQSAHLQALQALHQQGFPLALANFGMGFAPINVLREMPLALIKLPAHLSQSAHQSEESRKIIEGLLALAGALNLKVWVDHINEPEVNQFFQAQAVHFIQGSQVQSVV